MVVHMVFCGQHHWEDNEMIHLVEIFFYSMLMVCLKKILKSFIIKTSFVMY